VADDTFIERLRVDIEAEKQTLMDVAQFSAQIQDVNDEYKARRRTIRSSLKKLGLDDPNEWEDLWLWYGHYSDPNNFLNTNQYRREFVIETYSPLMAALENLEDRQLGTGIDMPETGWTQVDRQVAQLRISYARAETPEEFRSVGLLCRDIFVSLGHVIFDPEKHLPKGESMPKRDDPKNRLDYAVVTEFSGGANEKLRALIRSTWSFVQPRVHDQTEDRRDAMIAADATIHLVKVLAAMFPNPTGWLAPEQPEFEPGEDFVPQPDWEPDPEAMGDYLSWKKEDSYPEDPFVAP
jgi:hypothetical protein